MFSAEEVVHDNSYYCSVKPRTWGEGSSGQEVKETGCKGHNNTSDDMKYDRQCVQGSH